MHASYRADSQAEAGEGGSRLPIPLGCNSLPQMRSWNVVPRSSLLVRCTLLSAGCLSVSVKGKSCCRYCDQSSRPILALFLKIPPLLPRCQG